MPKPQAGQKDASQISLIPNTMVVVVLLPPKVAAMEVLPPPLSDKYYFVLGALGAQSTQQKQTDDAAEISVFGQNNVQN